MSDTHDTGPKGSPILLSMQQLMQFTSRIERMDAKLDAALTEQRAVPTVLRDHEDRIRDLEETNAVRDARGGLWRGAWEILFAIALAFIAAGIWLPKLGG
jgi:hypothetical protein